MSSLDTRASPYLLAMEHLRSKGEKYQKVMLRKCGDLNPYR